MDSLEAATKIRIELPPSSWLRFPKPTRNKAYAALSLHTASRLTRHRHEQRVVGNQCTLPERLFRTYLRFVGGAGAPERRSGRRAT